MRFKFIIFFFSISNLIFSQRYIDESTWILKVNLTSAIDAITFPTVQLAIEKELNDYISISSEVGYQFYNLKSTDTSFLKPQGFKVNLEFRYYITDLYPSDVSRSLGRVYLGLRPFYRQNKYNSSLSYQTNTDSVNWKDDCFGVKNNSYGFNFILGFQRSISNRLVLDLHAGLGIMYRKVRNTNLEYDKDSGDILGGTDFIRYIDTFDLNESSGLAVSVLFGLRIGYKL